MSQIDVPLSTSGFGQTRRADNWWVQPLFVFLGLSSFIVYATWAALQGDHYRFGPYISPFYSPEFSGRRPCLVRRETTWMPAWVTAAVLILWAPGGFRVTCYYYRGAYYKAFWADPPSCAVGEPRKSYLGRAFLPADPSEYPSLLSVSRADLSRAARARRLAGLLVRRRDFGIGVGTLVLLANVMLLSCYTLGCHSLAPSGRRRSRSASPARRPAKRPTTA